MRPVLKFTLCAAAMLAGAALPAHADDATCETEKLAASLESVQGVINNPTTLAAYVPQMDSYVKDCPNSAWINALGGEMDLMTYRGLRNANNGVPTQDAVNYLLRAFQRSNLFYAGPDETRNERYNIATSYSFYNNLTFGFASDSRGAIIDELVTLALSGNVHPYLSGTAPVECKGWVSSDSQNVSFEIKDARSMALLPFLEAAAEACRSAPVRGEKLPLAQLAKAYIRLVDTAVVTDPPEVRRMLLAAEKNATDYLGGDAYHSFYFDEADVNRLKSLVRKYGVHAATGEGLIDRSLWFKPEYLGSEEAIRSIVFSLDDYWTPLAAGETSASVEEVARARNRLTGYILELNKEGGAAGVQEEASAMLREAVTAFHKRTIISPGMEAGRELPDWLYNIMITLLTPKPPAAPTAQ